MARPTPGQQRVNQAKEALQQAATPSREYSITRLQTSLLLAFLAGLATGGSKLKNSRLSRTLLNLVLDWIEQ